MVGFFLKLAAIAAAAVMLASPAAATEKLYLAEYKLYTEALGARDVAAAEIHGHAAWQAAEAELGENNLTGILAYNYGNLVLFSAPEKAASALHRAEELRAAGIADLSAEELALRIAFSDFAAAENAKDKRRELRAILMSDAVQALPPSEDTARIWLRLASADVASDNFDDAVISAAEAEAAYSVLGAHEYRQRARALLLLGIATMFKDKAIADDVLLANKNFAKAGRLFPPQGNIETFDPILATILAWNDAAYALLESKYDFQKKRRDTYTGSRIKLNLPENDISDPSKFAPFDYDAIFPDSKSPEDCKIVWAKRDPPKYPLNANYRGYVGSVLVGYSLGSDLIAHNPVILAEVPGKVFGEATLASVAEWRLASPPSNDRGCRANRLTIFTFVLRS
ncbi:energy transducer TonB [Hyphococcus sp.]|uniref:energy transducer TonB n=1 Tax=Hyphococcus sp. TaxID=2038636 RepID=UPI0035C6F35B